MIVPLVIGLGFTAIDLAGLIALHAGKAIVLRVAECDPNAPLAIRVVEGCGVTARQVESVVQKIKAKVPQVQYGGVTMVPASEDGASKKGAITIGSPNAALRQNNRAVAVTTWAADSDDPDFGIQPNPATPETNVNDVIGEVDEHGYITEAYIGVDKLTFGQIDVELMLAHELLHAVGFAHTETVLFKRLFGHRVVGHKTGEIMNPTLDKAGWGVHGMEPLVAEIAAAKEHRKKHGKKQ